MGPTFLVKLKVAIELLEEAELSYPELLISFYVLVNDFLVSKYTTRT